MVDSIFPLLSFFKRFILRIDWPSIKRMPELKVPVLIISGTADELVPPDHSERLYNAAIQSKMRRMYKVPGGMHNDTWLKGGKHYISQLREFMDRAVYAKGTEEGGRFSAHKRK